MQAVFASPVPWESTTEKPVVNILVSWLQGIQMYACAWLALLSLEPCAIKLASCFQAFFFWGGGDFWGVSLLISHPGAACKLGTARAPTAICLYPSAPCLSCKG